MNNILIPDQDNYSKKNKSSKIDRFVFYIQIPFELMMLKDALWILRQETFAYFNLQIHAKENEMYVGNRKT
jgi:hypothetical protein